MSFLRRLSGYFGGGGEDKPAPAPRSSPLAPTGVAKAAAPKKWSKTPAARIARNESITKATGTGRWTAEEHDEFLKCLDIYGRKWTKHAEHITTRTTVQIRQHARDYFKNMKKAADAAAADAAAAAAAADGAPPDFAAAAYAAARKAYENSGDYNPELGADLDAYVSRTKNKARAAKLLCALMLPKTEERYPKGKRKNESQVRQNIKSRAGEVREDNKRRKSRAKK